MFFFVNLCVLVNFDEYLLEVDRILLVIVIGKLVMVVLGVEMIMRLLLILLGKYILIILFFIMENDFG